MARLCSKWEDKAPQIPRGSQLRNIAELFSHVQLDHEGNFPEDALVRKEFEVTSHKLPPREILEGGLSSTSFLMRLGQIAIPEARDDDPMQGMCF